MWCALINQFVNNSCARWNIQREIIKVIEHQIQKDISPLAWPWLVPLLVEYLYIGME